MNLRMYESIKIYQTSLSNFSSGEEFQGLQHWRGLKHDIVIIGYFTSKLKG